MQLKNILPALLLGAVSATPIDETSNAVQIARRQNTGAQQCAGLKSGIHVIALGGANTNDPNAIGKLGSLAMSIVKAIPGSDYVSMPYDKVQTNGRLQAGAVANGMKTLKQYVVQYHASCPGTKIAIIGYSSGGVIMMNDICLGGDGNGTPQLNPALKSNKQLANNGWLADNVVAVVAYGEETRVAGQGFNTGTCTDYSATHPRANPSLCYRGYARYIQSYCDNGDPDCCVGSPGQDINVHFSYPSKYDQTATNFVVAKVNQAHAADRSAGVNGAGCTGNALSC